MSIGQQQEEGEIGNVGLAPSSNRAVSAPTVCVCFLPQGTDLPHLECLRVCDEYLEWCEKHPSHLRMVRGHVHKLITVSWAQLSPVPHLRFVANRVLLLGHCT